MDPDYGTVGSYVHPYRKPRHPGQKAYKNRKRVPSGNRGSWRNKPVTTQRRYAQWSRKMYG